MHILNLRYAASLLLAPLIMSSPLAHAAQEDQTNQAETTVFAVGAGMDRMPKWIGAGQSKTHAIPYFDINWHDRVELSSTDGLTIDMIHAKPWHGGLIGTMMWGRSNSDLGELSGIVDTLNVTHQAGAYLEYDFSKALSAGVRIRHDIQQTGAAYGDLYADLDLPAPGPVEHSVKLDAAFMNRSAMQRLFGLSQDAANTLGTSAYRPGSGLESVSLGYQAFLPTSQSTGFVLGASWGLLTGPAADSPLVRHYGSKIQRGYMAAFMAHF